MSRYYARQYRLRLPFSALHIVARYRRYLLIAILLALALAVHVGRACLEGYRAELPNVNRLRAFEPSQTTRIFSSDGRLIGTLFHENRSWVALKDMSPWLPKALVAVEDNRFYEHSGVDPLGILRAGYQDLRSGRKEEGASTITMQLTRNLFLTPERSFTRKIREALTAMEIEKSYSKDQILEFYLNQIYFGSGAYGAQAASSQYFNCSVSKLSIAQAALLAGLPKAPSELSPFVDLAACKKRQRLVLSLMLDQGCIDWTQYRQALSESRNMSFHHRIPRQQLLKVPYFTSYVIHQLSKRYSEEQLYRGGLQVYTSVDLKLQELAEKTVTEMVQADERSLNVHQASLVTLENQTGYIRAMVGGLGFNRRSQFNRAWQARRQAGSSFKPILYATALEAGYTPSTLMKDTPVKFLIPDSQPWEPKNSDGKFLGEIPLWLGLQRSRNVVSARLIDAVTPELVVSMAGRLGIGNLTPSLSLALGTAEVSPLEMVSAYSVFANDGVQIQPTVILRVIDGKGETLEDNRIPDRQLVLTEKKARTMVWMMHRVVDFGTGTLAQIPGRPTAGKTGTTDSSRDTWFVGYTPQFTTAVWAGNDDYSKMWNAMGGDLPARIFRQVMIAAHGKLPILDFPTVSGQAAVRVDFCTETNRRATAFCPKRYKVMMDPSLVSEDRCPKHAQPATVEVRAGNQTATNGTATPDYKQISAPEPTTKTDENRSDSNATDNAQSGNAQSGTDKNADHGRDD